MSIVNWLNPRARLRRPIGARLIEDRRQRSLSVRSFEQLEDRSLLSVLAPSSDPHWQYDHGFPESTYIDYPTSSSHGATDRKVTAVFVAPADQYGLAVNFTQQDSPAYANQASYDINWSEPYNHTGVGLKSTQTYSLQTTLAIEPTPGERIGDPVQIMPNYFVNSSAGGYAKRVNSASFSFAGSLTGGGKTMTMQAISHQVSNIDNSNALWNDSYQGGAPFTAKVGDQLTLTLSASCSLDVEYYMGISDEFFAGTEIGVTVKVLPAVTDIAAKPLVWDPIKSGIDLGYHVDGNLPQPLVAQVAWVGVGGKALSSFNVQLGTPSPGDYSTNVPESRLGLPPAGATGVTVKYDPFNSISEDKSNNTASTTYSPAITNLTARLDGDSRDNVIGRFFKDVPVNDQVFHFKLSDSLAAIQPQVTFQISGVGKLTATAESGGVTYDTASFDGTAALPPNTHVTAQAALANGASPVATADALIDIVPLPKWMDFIKPFGDKRFDPATMSYIFSGSLFDFDSSKVKGFTIPMTKGKQTVWFGGGTKNGLGTQVDISVATGLDPTKKPVTTGSAKAQLTYLGNSLVLGSNVDVKSDLDPRTLAINAMAFTYHDSGSSTIPLFTGTVLYAPPFEIKSDVKAKIDYTADLAIVLKKDGTLDAGQSDLNFAANSTLSGSIEIPGFDIGSGLLKKGLKAFDVVAKAAAAANPGALAIQELAGYLSDALKKAGLLPSFHGSAEFSGIVSLHGQATLSGTPRNPKVSRPLLSGKLKVLAPHAQLSFVWPVVQKDPIPVTDFVLSDLAFDVPLP